MPKRFRVSFSAETKDTSHVNKNVAPSHQHFPILEGGESTGRSRKKRPRPDTNMDELDDLDEYDQNDDEGSETDFLNEHDLLEAKRARRLAQTDDIVNGGEPTTKIDPRTSLAAEGISIEPFHMRNEGNDGSGYFDGDTYVFRKRDPEEDEPDAWLESLKDAKLTDFAAAAAASMARSSPGDNKEPSFSDSMDQWSETEIYAKMLPLVSDTETILQAISRYGNLLQKNRNDKNKNSSTDHQQASRHAQGALNDLTQAASALLLHGRVDIYQQTRNDLQELLLRHDNAAKASALALTTAAYAATGVDAVPQPAVTWEYQGNQDGKIHGPYTTAQLKQWIHQGYFVGPTAVQIRSIADTSLSRLLVEKRDDLLADLMEDDAGEAAKMEHVKGEWMLSDQVDFDKYC